MKHWHKGQAYKNANNKDDKDIKGKKVQGTTYNTMRYFRYTSGSQVAWKRKPPFPLESGFAEEATI